MLGKDGVYVEVQELEAEIAGLEDAIIAQERQNQLKKQWRDYHCHRRKGMDTDNTDTSNIDLKQQVAFLKQSTGVVISDASTSIVSQDNLSMTKKISMTGYCNNTMFDLDMDIEQTMDLDANVKSKILHLSISASENIYRDLKETVDKLVDQGNAQGFLTLLQPYSTWDKNRDVTFEHFMKKYPKIVSRPSVPVLRLSHPKKKCTFDITWTFKVTDIYNVLPDIKLEVQVPKKVKDSNDDVLETLPEKFLLMLEQLGIEQTLHALISLFK